MNWKRIPHKGKNVSMIYYCGLSSIASKNLIIVYCINDPNRHINDPNHDIDDPKHCIADSNGYINDHNRYITEMLFFT